MNIYKSPESKIQNEQETNSNLNKGWIASRISLGAAIFLYLLWQYISVAQGVYIIVIALLILVLFIVGFICGIVGLIGYFKSKNKYTLWCSLAGIVVTVSFLGIYIFYLIEAMLKFNVAS